MTEQINASVDTGSVVEKQVDPNNLGGGSGQSTSQPQKSSEEMVSKSQYTELEKKLGSQGEELGKYRDYLEEITPLLERLDSQPELVKAILDGSVDSNLAQAVIDGKVSVKEAEVVTKAHDDVKEDLGTKEYAQATPEEINKLIEERINKATLNVEDKVKKTLSEESRMRDYETKVKDFVRNTSDYADYAVEVNAYLDAHPTLDDIEVAYNAVKGIKLQKEKEELVDKEKAEAAKGFAANAGGGGARNATISNPDDISKYINLNGNPNKF